MQLTSQPVRAATGPRPAVVLALLAGAPFLAGLDLFVVNVAFTAIGAGFPGHSAADLSWVLNGYAIVYAALLVPVGRWADRVGPKRVFLAGLAAFTGASAVCAVAPNLWILVAFRAVQAAGAAAVTPTSLGLLLHAVPADRRAVSVRLWAATSAVASTLGPIVGGVLVEWSWRWIFLINVPLGLALVAGAARGVPGYRAEQPDTRLDLTGTVLLTAGISAAALGLVEGNDWGWTGTGTTTSLAVAAAALAAFALHTARHPSPLIAPALLRVRTFAWSNAAALVFNASFAAGLLAAILWLQHVWGYSALRTGLAIAPGPLMVPLCAIGGRRLAGRIPAGVLACAGSVLWALGAVVLLLSAGARPDYVRDLLPGWIVCGIGVGLTLPTILSSATSGLPPARSATGSAIVTMTRQIGTVLGVSMLIALLGSPTGYPAVHAAFRGAWAAVAATGLISAAVSPGLSPRPAAR